MDALDELASALRSRLIERARDGAAGGGLEDEVRALVDDQAGPLPEAERDALAERVVLPRRDWDRSSRCWPTPGSTRS